MASESREQKTKVKMKGETMTVVHTEVYREFSIEIVHVPAVEIPAGGPFVPGVMPERYDYYVDGVDWSHGTGPGTLEEALSLAKRSIDVKLNHYGDKARWEAWNRKADIAWSK